MSSAVIDRPMEAVAEPEWVIIDDAPLLEHTGHSGSVEIRGRGRDQYGAIRRGGIRPAPPNLVALPPVDDLD